MSKQKFVVFILAIIGMIATFLPWYEVNLYGSIAGYQSAGWFTFIMFAVAFLFALRGRLKENMGVGWVYVGSGFSLAAAFVVLWRIINIYLDKEGAVTTLTGEMMAEEVRILYGAYQVVIAGICLPFGAFLFQGKK